MKRRDLFKVLEDITLPKEIIDSGYPGISNEQSELFIKGSEASKEVGVVFEFDSDSKNQTIGVYLAENGYGVFKRSITLNAFAKLYAEGKLEFVKRGRTGLGMVTHGNYDFGGPSC